MIELGEAPGGAYSYPIDDSAAAKIARVANAPNRRGQLNYLASDEVVCPYVVTPRWILDALLAGAASPVLRGLQLPLHAGAFQASLPLLRHGALDADHAPELDPARGVRLRRSFAETRVKGFVADARKLACNQDLALRNRAVHLRTENALTGRFVPPAAGDVRAALATALKCIDAMLESHRGDAGKTAICALLGAQILLTIHPFRDGNGRTARMFFAAKVLRHLGPAPTALLGMLLMHRSGAHQYHQACWALRAGDAEPIVGLFVDSEMLAAERLLQDSKVGLSPPALLERSWEELRRLL